MDVIFLIIILKQFMSKYPLNLISWLCFDKSLHSFNFALHQQGAVTAVAFSRTGEQFASGSVDQQVRIFLHYVVLFLGIIINITYENK